MWSGEFAALLEIIRQALLLNPAVYVAVQNTPAGLWIAVTVVLLASLSEAAGQSVVLFLNRIRPSRLWLALGITTGSQLVGYAVWSFTIWWVGGLLFGTEKSLIAVASVVGLAYAPQIFSFLVLIPFLGDGIGLLLSLWSMFAVVVAINAGLSLETWQAAALAAFGWLLLQSVRRTIGRPVESIQRWLTGQAAGVPLRVRTRDLPRLRRRPIRDWYTQLESWRINHALRSSQPGVESMKQPEQNHVRHDD